MPLNPRRLIVSVLLGFGLLAVSVGAAGVASGPVDVPSHLALPLPHGGDVARYEVHSGDQVTDHTTVEVMPEQAVADANGTWHRAHAIVTEGDKPAGEASSTAGGVEVHMVFANRQIDWLDSGSLDRVARQEGAGGGGAASWDSSPLPFLGTSHVQASQDFITDLRPGPDCDLLPALWHGVDLTQAVVVHHCAGLGKSLSLRATGTDLVGNLTAVRLDAQTTDSHGDQATLSYWVHPGIPFPVRTLVVPAASGKTHGSRLIGFRPGTDAWHGDVALPAQPVPAVVVARAEPWGPSDQGVNHPFPLSAAWAAARDQSTGGLHDFLAAHPEARACQATFAQATQGQRTDRTWRLVAIAQDRSGLAFSVQQTTAPPGSDETGLLGVPSPLPPQQSISVTQSSDGNAMAKSCLLPSEMAASLPTVASAMAAWSGFTGSASAPNDWSFLEIQGGIQVGVGQAGLTLPASSLLQSSATNATQDLQTLFLDAGGRAFQLVSIHSTYEARQEGLMATSVPPVDGTGVQARPSVAGIVPLPSLPAAAGLSVLSLLLAVGYYLWPMGKGGLVGLFSRVREDDLLVHPVRRRLVDLVEAQPGIHFQALVRAAGAGNGATEHHLRKLVAAGRLKRHAGTGFTCYFPPRAQAVAVAAAPALKSDGARRILAAIQLAPGASARDVAAATGLDPGTVTHHVQRLQAAGLVEARRVGRSLALQATAGSSPTSAVAA